MTDHRNVTTLPVDQAAERALLHHTATGHVVYVLHEDDAHKELPGS